MVEFSKEELDIIERFLQMKMQNPGPFSFKGLTDYFKGSTATDKEARQRARELGERIRQSVEDTMDQRMNFEVTHYYDDGVPQKIDGGSISYTFIPT